MNLCYHIEYKNAIGKLKKKKMIESQRLIRLGLQLLLLDPYCVVFSFITLVTFISSNPVNFFYCLSFYSPNVSTVFIGFTNEIITNYCGHPPLAAIYDNLFEVCIIERQPNNLLLLNKVTIAV